MVHTTTPVNIPHVPHGPLGIPAHEATAQYYREAAKSIRWHKKRGAGFAGSNVTEAVATLCENAADAITNHANVHAANTIAAVKADWAAYVETANEGTEREYKEELINDMNEYLDRFLSRHNFS